MTRYITYLKDVVGSNYIGIHFERGEVAPHLDRMRKLLGDVLFEEFSQNQQYRDHNEFHTTVLSVAELNKLIDVHGADKVAVHMERLMKHPINNIQMLGIGTAQKADNRAYFVVLKSDELQALRRSFDLDVKDFHITIGFKHKDVFGVRKDQVLGEEGELLPLLRNSFIERSNLEFLKKITNWNISPDMDITPIDLSDSILKVEAGGRILGIGVIDGDTGPELRVVFDTEKQGDERRLPLTEIIELLGV